jgi:hypothetical protein
MKLDRNINPNGIGKYALLKLRMLENVRDPGAFGELASSVAKALELLEMDGILDWGNTPQTDFMVIRLKDKYAQAALRAYADAARSDDPEYAAEIDEMAARSGPSHPFCKRPD